MPYSSPIAGSALNYAARLREPQGSEGPSLPVRRAFVLQLDSGSDVEHGEISGRLEHLSSGRRQRFATLRALADLLSATITEIESPGGSDE